MRNLNKIVGLGLIIGTILQITRMIPIILSNGVTLLQNFPPHNTEDSVFVSTTVGWLPSHLMVFLATPFLLVGFYGLFKVIKNTSEKSKFGYFGVVILLFGLILYTIGAVIDGLTLTDVSKHYLALEGDSKNQLDAIVYFTHRLAVSFGGTAFAHLLIGTGVLGLGLMHTKYFKTFGIVALLIGIISLLGYLFGVLDLLINTNFLLTGGLTIMMFVFYLVLGLKIFKHETLEIK